MLFEFLIEDFVFYEVIYMNENIEVLVSNDNLVNGALNNNFGYQEKLENRKSIRAGLTFKSVGELMNEKIEINWLVKDFIMQDTLCILYAQPASGKSVAALSLAVSVATGTDWYGHQTQQGSVVYLAGEGQAGLKRRLKAIQLSRSISLEDAPFLLHQESPLHFSFLLHNTNPLAFMKQLIDSSKCKLNSLTSNPHHLSLQA